MQELFTTGPEGNRYYNDCQTCQKHLAAGETFFPQHETSSHCLSGNHPHCTCDMCF